MQAYDFILPYILNGYYFYRFLYTSKINLEIILFNSECNVKIFHIQIGDLNIKTEDLSCKGFMDLYFKRHIELKNLTKDISLQIVYFALNVSGSTKRLCGSINYCSFSLTDYIGLNNIAHLSYIRISFSEYKKYIAEKSQKHISDEAFPLILKPVAGIIREYMEMPFYDFLMSRFL